MRALSTLFGLALLAAGCAKPDTRAYVRALERMATLTEESRHDCNAMASALDRFFDEGEGQAIVEYQENYRRLTKRERDAVENAEYGPRVKAAMHRLMPAHKRCADHDAVHRTFAQYF